MPPVHHTERSAGGQPGSDPDERSHRFVLGPDPVSVFDHHHVPAGHRPGEAHQACGSGAHDHAAGGTQVDAEVARSIRGRGRREAA
jgi:hypothetical protein